MTKVSGLKGDVTKCHPIVNISLKLPALFMDSSSHCVGSHLKNCVPKPLNDSDNTESEDLAVVEQLASEMVKQEMLVQYLQDAYNFSVKIMEATSMVSRMMYGNSVSGR